ncbi:MAG TPA: glucosidase, partial [Coriobacteriia bacterium]|nr:glucosidase [Coriobacteriia bacterium]
MRLTSASARAKGKLAAKPLGAGFDRVLEARRQEADEFYATVIDASLGEDAANVMRQALAGMLWGKQYYEYDVHMWLREHSVNPWSTHAQVSSVRNASWFHLDAGDVISMPDKWEYPWFAAWDLALQTVPLSLVDVDFAKGQMELLLKDRYLHPNGQVPAYEWNFSDVNPPLQAWSAMYLYEREREIRGEGDIDFLQRVFQRLLMNFTWWVNRKDPDGRNLFQGGFLGLDNIGVFDRLAPLPGGGTLEQADGTAWMALYCQAMLEMALELTRHGLDYEEMAAKFTMHFVWIAAAMGPPDGDALWDEEDGFYYDVMRLPDGSTQQLRVRSLVGLLPMCAATVIEPELLERVPDLLRRFEAFVEKYKDSIPALTQLPGPSVGGKRLASLVGEQRLRRILAVMLDESEFLGPHGIRAISRYHADHPYVFDIAGQEFRVDYEPAESHTGMFGGNSNWRGPVWFPMNLVILRGLRGLGQYYGDNLKVECPTGSGDEMNLTDVANELGRRLAAIFLRGQDGRRPVFGGIEPFQTDPH